MATPITELSYGALTTSANVICDKVRVNKRYDGFGVSGNLVLTALTTVALKTLCDTVQDEIRKENQALLVKVNAITIFTGSPLANTASVIRGNCNVIFTGALSAKIDFSFDGKLPPQSQPAAGFYQFNYNFNISQSERISATISGIYSSTAGNTAPVNYANAGTGAKARCAVILNAYFPGLFFDVTKTGKTMPEEGDDWLQFSLTYVQRIIPKYVTAPGSGPYYDFSSLRFTQSRSGWGGNALEGHGETHGINWASAQGDVPADFEAGSGGVGAPDEGTVRYSLSGEIPVYSTSRDYVTLMSEWETYILPALWELIFTYFITSAENSGDFGEVFIQSSNVPFDVTENGISPNLSIVVPGSGGVIEYADTLSYSIDPRYIVEYYLTYLDDYRAWIGKMPTEITCVQNCRVTSIGSILAPMAPPFPEGITNVVWIQMGPARFEYKSELYNIKTNNNVRVSVKTVSYTCQWKLVSTYSVERFQKSARTGG